MWAYIKERNLPKATGKAQKGSYVCDDALSAALGKKYIGFATMASALAANMRVVEDEDGDDDDDDDDDGDKGSGDDAGGGDGADGAAAAAADVGGDAAPANGDGADGAAAGDAAAAQ